jgi:2-C-methyl-D-erythritol 2,4-cyclodiphosphate synthase
LLGHSDGDVLLHAICDALLGAAGLGDIGRKFPDTDPALRDADSSELLTAVGRQIVQLHYTIANIDATLVAQRPRMASHIPTMAGNIARLLQIHRTQVNVKAKTNERLGSLGRNEGIAAHALVLLELALPAVPGT